MYLLQYSMELWLILCVLLVHNCLVTTGDSRLLCISSVLWLQGFAVCFARESMSQFCDSDLERCHRIATFIIV